MKILYLTFALFLSGLSSALACTGISFFAKDGGYVQARTIEWGDSFLPSEYVIIPRNLNQTSYTPTGINGLKFKSKYGVVGLAIIQKEFIAEGLNEAGLSADYFISLITESIQNMTRNKTAVHYPIYNSSHGYYPIFRLSMK